MKCFVVIDLKTGKLTHQDIGQIDFYVRYFEDKIKSADDNPTIGIILCADKNEAMEKNTGLLMFYCSQFMKDSIYYLPQENTIIIAEIEENKISLYDIFAKESVALDTLIGALVSGSSANIVLGFSPKNTDGWQVDERLEDDTTFYVLSSNENIFAKNKLMFPLLSHA